MTSSAVVAAASATAMMASTASMRSTDTRIHRQIILSSYSVSSNSSGVG
jgi:hypothetical protein